MAYYQDFDSEEEDPHPFDTMSDQDDDTLQKLSLFKPLGYRFLSRLTGLTELALRESFTTTLVSPERQTYDDIETYFQNGQCHSFKLRMTKLFRIRRFEDVNCFADETLNRKLLWHGTKTENITSILTLGFTRPSSRGQLFGTGIYFSDRTTKSAQYSMGGTPLKGTKGHLFLCAVSLGKIYQSQTPNCDQMPPGYDSILGAGQYIPDEKASRFYKDAEIPCGKTINRPASLGLGTVNIPLRFNEYVVYDVDRCTIKFLVEFEVI